MTILKVGEVILDTENQITLIQTQDKEKVILGLTYNDMPALRGVSLPAELEIPFDERNEVNNVNLIRGTNDLTKGLGGLTVIGTIPLALWHGDVKEQIPDFVNKISELENEKRLELKQSRKKDKKK